MSRPTPRVSIGLPVYNGERYVTRAIDSILAQDFPDLELIISDNASEDGTEAICRGYAKRDPRISYHRHDANLGAAFNYNFVFKQATGEFFKWAPHDDECAPSLIRRCVETFDAAPDDVVLVYPRGVFIDAEGVVIGNDRECLETRHAAPHRRLARIVARVSLASAVVGLIRTSTLAETRLIQSYAACDYVLLAELALRGQIWEVPEPLFRRRLHAETHRMVHRSRKAAAAWFDPSRAGSRLRPPLPIWGQYLRAVHRSGLGVLDRLRCYATVPLVHFWRRFRVRGGQCKRWLRGRLDRKADKQSLIGV